MLLHLLISLISYHHSFTVESNKIQFNLPIKYEFESGGKFNIKINNCTLNKLFFLIAPQDKTHEIEINNINIDFAHYIEIKKGSGEITGNIQEKGIYVSKIVSCEYPIDDYQIIIEYQNKDSFLSLNLVSYLSTLPLFINISIFFLNLWMICIIKHSNFDVRDFELTVCYFCFAFGEICHYFYLKKVSDFDCDGNHSLETLLTLFFNLFFGECLICWFTCNADSNSAIFFVRCVNVFALCLLENALFDFCGKCNIFAITGLAWAALMLALLTIDQHQKFSCLLAFPVAHICMYNLVKFDDIYISYFWLMVMDYTSLFLLICMGLLCILRKYVC